MFPVVVTVVLQEDHF